MSGDNIEYPIMACHLCHNTHQPYLLLSGFIPKYYWGLAGHHSDHHKFPPINQNSAQAISDISKVHNSICNHIDSTVIYVQCIYTPSEQMK